MSRLPNMNRKIVMARRPVGLPKLDDFVIVEAPIPEPKDGEMLVRAHYLSADPLQRYRMDAVSGYGKTLAEGDVVKGRLVGEIVQSRHPDYKVGEFVEGMLGWQEYAISDGSTKRAEYAPGIARVDPKVAPISTSLGILGFPGVTAYFALTEICKPKVGETVVVTGAAGAVGSLAGQIAKIMGARVVGIADAVTSFTGGPYVWTTYERALQYVPSQRKLLQAVICAPREGVSLDQAIADIRRETGLKAFANREAGFGDFLSQMRDEPTTNFNVSTVWWYIKNTGIPISFGITVIVGLMVGIAVSCQTFYSFVLENMRHLGALKAMGTSNGTLCLMLITQAFTVGIIGYGIGLLGTAGFAFGALKNEQPPFYMPEFVPFAVLAVVLGICTLAALLGIWRVSRLEPAMVFRS